ncbi:MAG: CPBP family intramembrane glutamic endopeptidase [Planctomycetota bacterium]
MDDDGSPAQYPVPHPPPDPEPRPAEAEPDLLPDTPAPLLRAWLWLEMGFLYAFLPGLIAAVMNPSDRFDGLFRAVGLDLLADPPIPPGSVLMPMLLITGALLGLWLALDKRFPSKQLWNWRAFRADARRIFGLFAIGAVIMLSAAYLLSTLTDVMTITGRDGREIDAFLRLPREAPFILIAIAVFYPWLSAYPQEITHRAFFFHRYRRIIPDIRVLFVLNVLAFVWLHAMFWHWMAFAVTLPGGILFAWTYVRTKSTLAAGMEHAIYGWWLFFTGMGWFVFTGSVGSG